MMMKYYILAGAIAAALGLWAIDRHHQYTKGKETCELSVAADNGNILLFLQNERALYEQKAAREAATDDVAIQEAEDIKPIVIERIVNNAKSSPVGPDVIVLSNDELLYYNSLIEATNTAGKAKD